MNPKEVVQQYVAAVQAGDEQAIRNLFASDATWTLAGALPISGVWKGRTAIIDEFLATAMSRYQPGSISLEITGMIAEHDQVVLQWTSRARTSDGRPYENVSWVILGGASTAAGRGPRLLARSRA